MFTWSFVDIRQISSRKHSTHDHGHLPKDTHLLIFQVGRFVSLERDQRSLPFCISLWVTSMKAPIKRRTSTHIQWQHLLRWLRIPKESENMMSPSGTINRIQIQIRSDLARRAHRELDPKLYRRGRVKTNLKENTVKTLFWTIILPPSLLFLANE